MNYIIFDLEATCWRGRPPKGITEVIEIGACKVSRYGRIEEEFSQFVKPIVNPILSDFCKKLTNISQENVERAKTFDKVIEDFIQWSNLYEEEYILLSWGADDRLLLRNDCRMHKVDNDWVDEYRDLKKAYRNLKSLRNASGLKATVRDEGFEFTGLHHRAISDAQNLAKIFIKYFEEWNLGY